MELKGIDKAEDAYVKIINELNLDNDELWCKLHDSLEIMDDFFRDLRFEEDKLHVWNKR